MEVSYQTTFQASGDGKAVWGPFSKDGRLANNGKSWVSEKEKLGGAIAAGSVAWFWIGASPRRMYG